MKALLIFLLALPFAVKGQKYYVDTTVWVRKAAPTINKYDTVPVIMWVSDTALHYQTKESFYIDPIKFKEDSIKYHNDSTLYSSGFLWGGRTRIDTIMRYYNNYVWQMRGYEVIEKYMINVQYINGNHIPLPDERETQRHENWLDADKKPLKLFVGISFPINKNQGQ